MPAGSAPVPPPTLTHAGGVVHRTDEARLVTLLVRGRGEPRDWVIPKGHIEAGETAAQTARREVREETGVDASATDYLGECAFTRTDGKFIRVGWFLMQFHGLVAADEDRETRWCTFREAQVLVRFDDLRRILAAAERLAGPKSLPTW